MEDTQLIAACRRQDAAAQRQLYEAYLPYVLTIVRRFGVAAPDQPDVIQDIFVEVFAHLDRFDPARGELKYWIRSIVINRLLKQRRSVQRGTPVPLDAIAPEELATEADTTDLDIDYLIELIAGLPEGYREVFNLYVVDGYTHQQIAARLGITPVGSRSQLSRAKAWLRRVIRKQQKNRYHGIL